MISRKGNAVIPSQASRFLNGQKTCCSAMNCENQMGLQLTNVNQSRLVISRKGSAVMPSRASPGNKCVVDGQKTCCSAINFENRMGLKLTCVNRSHLAISRKGNAVMPSRASPGNVVSQETISKIEWD